MPPASDDPQDIPRPRCRTTVDGSTGTARRRQEIAGLWVSHAPEG
ncbi:hypothetical protein [Streptomyces nigrescens]